MSAITAAQTIRLLAVGSLIGLGCAMTVPELREKGHRESIDHNLPLGVAAEYFRAFESLGCREFSPLGSVDVFVRSESVLWVTVRGVTARGVSDKAALFYEVSPHSVTAYYRFESTGPRVRYALERIAAGSPAVCER